MMRELREAIQESGVEEDLVHYVQSHLDDEDADGYDEVLEWLGYR